MPTLSELRRRYHADLQRDVLGVKGDAFTNADASSRASVDLAARVARRLGGPYCAQPPKPQAAGQLFARHTASFLEASFRLLAHVRPGDWKVSTEQKGIAVFDQYEHLNAVERVLKTHKDLRATLGGDYFVNPDITVSRLPLGDAELNAAGLVVDGASGLLSPLRARARDPPLRILHASISCKWTMRSDRAQNTRTEALNLLRNRKGRTPHVLAVTFEPLPTRLASIAMGTGDLDCTYHAALPELMQAVQEAGNEDQWDILGTLVDGRRLRDISDIPLDLAA